ncbi:AraC family transcriptional regulator [Achromobacter arsenitoxydans]|uniref:AraC family transcriptional regulator n=1 Tax=Achromobacter arsenitoxydans SY8 TaxID=477184 RepID=H0FDE5_9BURK|nr:AraC family transcriptional regulator [Achromobacter arsenitoxydans]EHK63658.1 AraC family transcriptional regulator [Achromobacter arsenitoxydans SY8]
MTTSIDRLSPLLERFRVRAQLFHAGPLCGLNRFAPEPGRGFLHVLRRGDMEVGHRPGSGLPRRLRVAEPTLLFYPRPVHHEFHNPPQDGSDFTCATLHFDGGDRHPLVRALPPLIALPLARVGGLEQALGLLFAETEQVRCGQRLLADRLFEVVLIQLLRWLIDHAEEAGIQVGVMTGLSDPRLARALVAMHEAPGAPWSLADLAARAGMSRSAFAAAFKDLVGQPPADYLADWRLALAQSRLRDGQAVKTIALELGYANASALSRVFSQKIGASPRQWLDRQKAPS